ncbi:MAG TPA: hypothetical protein VNS32_29315, partial [Flavisolibacter sp.]|nr:hypothetical protein [Flavisolibacter sp.]
KEFLKLVFIAIFIAVPLCIWVMSQWLDDFAYRISISPGIFILTAIVALFIALATISWQSIKAALANPVWALRNE